MDKVNFAKLCKLSDLWKNDAAWQANVKASGVEDGLTIATDDEDGDGGPIIEEIDPNTLRATIEVQMYDFAGSENEAERFYAREGEIIYVDANGVYWATERDELYEF